MPPLLCHQQLVLLPYLLDNVSFLVSLVHGRELRQNLAIDVVALDVLWIPDDVLFNHSSEEVPQLELLQRLLPQAVARFVLELVELLLDLHDLAFE